MLIEEKQWTPFFPWKALLYPRECEGIVKGDFLPPVVLHIYVTNKCNSNCAWCIMREERALGGELDRDVFRDIVEQAIKLGVKAIHISGGGEPLLYKHLHILDRFPGKKILSTNGIAIRDTYSARDLWKLFDRIRISIDAGSSGVYDDVRGGELTFCKVLDNCRALSEDDGRDGTKTLGLGFVLDHNNWKDTFDFCQIPKVRDFDADFLHIRPAYYPRGSEEDRMVREIIRPAYHLCEAARGATNVPIFAISDKFRGYWTPRSTVYCYATPLHAVVTATAEFIVCQDVFIRFGDLKRQRFGEIWGGHEHKEAIARIGTDKCPRCVMNNANEIIEKVFVEDQIMKELL